MQDLKILIVDDRRDSLNTTIDRLKEIGLNDIDFAENQYEALKKAEIFRPDIVLMDVNLIENDQSDTSGVEVAKILRDRFSVPIVFITGYETRQAVRNVLSENRNFKWIGKPPSPNELKEALQLALQDTDLATLRSAPERNKIFICYSHQDAARMEEMVRFLRHLSDFGITAWHDQQIQVGRRWATEIPLALSQAKVAILLVSIDFCNSDFISMMKLPRILASESEQGLTVYAVHCGYCNPPILNQCGILPGWAVNPPDDPIEAWQRPRRNRECWGKMYEDILNRFLRHLESKKAIIPKFDGEHTRDSEGERFIHPQERKSILFLASDPEDAPRISLGPELREVDRILQTSKRYDWFIQLACRPADIANAVLQRRPEILHFSGHGQKNGQLCFENNDGTVQPVESDAMVNLLRLNLQVTCVVFNACHSKDLAVAVSQQSKYAIGMDGRIEDLACQAFSIGFYQALAAGVREIETAFAWGRMQIQFNGLDDYKLPVLAFKGEIKNI